VYENIGAPAFDFDRRFVRVPLIGHLCYGPSSIFLYFRARNLTRLRTTAAVSICSLRQKQKLPLEIAGLMAAAIRGSMESLWGIQER
jgi:hypothetical protein